jgi:uroporphyrinogen-III synthase
MSPQLPRLSNVQLFAVGPRTGKVARELGFQRVVEGPGTGAELADIIDASDHPKEGRIVHLAGETLAFDMASSLSSKGYRAETFKCYRSVPAQSFTAEVEKAIRENAIDLVTLLSPRTAKTFVKLIKSAGLEQTASVLSYACISEATRKPLHEEGWPRTHVARAPNSQEVLALVNWMASQSRQ